MLSRLETWAGERGFRVACGGVAVLREVRAELARRRSAGELDAEFCAGNLGFFRYESSAASMAEPKAVIVVAVPRPAHRVTFETPAGVFETVLPPTYLRYRSLFTEVGDDLVASIPKLRGHLEVLLAPLKSVACRLGLAVYGRNNLSYISEWGSYFQLLGYLTDQDIGLGNDGQAIAPRLMSECENCGACAAACPTGAISDERMLLHAEDCATLFSEKDGELTRDWSADCLFGCLECQRICPANSGLLRIEAAAGFDRQETEAILAGRTRQNEASAALGGKLGDLGLTEEALIGRNLSHLIAARARGQRRI